MPAPTQEHIIEAVQTATHNYAKGESVSGIRKLAMEMDMSPSSLGNALNPYADRSVVKLGLEQALFIMRQCHDCGKKTTDYRCPACRKKHAKRNGISGKDEASWTDDFAVGV